MFWLTTHSYICKHLRWRRKSDIVKRNYSLFIINQLQTRQNMYCHLFRSMPGKCSTLSCYKVQTENSKTYFVKLYKEEHRPWKIMVSLSK